MIFFDLNNRQYKAIGEDAFDGCNNLKYFELPETVTLIKSEAFNSCGNMFETYSNEDIKNFFKNIEGIEDRAFVSVGGKDKTFYFSDKLKYLRTYTFRFAKM
jgi:hypothetical protein